jgi:molybdopterin converting factor small subunit
MPLTEHLRQRCWVEFLGPARLLAGVKQAPLEVNVDARLRDLIPLLAKRFPTLVGPVLDLERQRLVDGYIFNVNGRTFAPTLDVRLDPEDRVLLLANAAGG